MILSGTSRRWLPVVLLAVAGLVCLGPSAADAAILKRVHSGTTAVPSAAGVNVPLELPDSTKAFVVCSPRTTNGNSNRRVTCVLSNNNLAIDGGTNVGATVTVSWYVAEFESGVSVVSGTSTFNAGSTTPAAAPAIGTVDCSKSFVVLAGEQNNAANASTNDEQFTFRAVLGTFAAPCAVTAGTTTSTLSIARNATVNAATMAWQVVTMDGATVLSRGVATIAQASTTAAVAVAASTPTTAFIVMSRAAGSAVAGVEAEYQVRADFSGAGPPYSQVTFTRAVSNNVANHQVDIAYEVVNLGDGGTVQRGQTVSAGVTATMGGAGNITAIDRSAAVPFFAASGGAAATSTYLDETSWSAAFPSTTQLQFTRGTSSALVGTANWFVVSFYKCPNSRVCSVGVAGGAQAATVSWSPLYDPQCLSGTTPTACQALVVRDTAAIAWAPANATVYTVGTQPAGGPATMRVGFNGTGQSFSQTAADGLANGTQYFYRVYPVINGTTNYITDAGMTQAISQVNVTPAAGNLAWSYMTTGGSTLNAPIPGTGRVYVGSNGSKMVALDSSTGVELATPAITNGAIQSYLAWFPVSGGSNEAVVVGDQTGRLTSINGVTGARNWTIQLPVDAGGFIQAALTAQLRDGYNPLGPCDGGTFLSTYTTDLIYVASRNTSQTVNSVWAVRADTGAIVWTFTGSPSMDRAAGQPYIDYCTNRLWVSTGRGSTGLQKSVWVINTITGVEVTSINNVGVQTNSAPTLSYDGTTVYAGDAAGNVYAFNATAAPPTLKYSQLLTGGPAITGFIWEDWSQLGRLYIPVVSGGSAGVWCLQDTGAGFTNCADWIAANPRIPVAAGTLAQPMVTDTAIFFPGSDGKIYQISMTDGTLVGTAFTVESGTALGGVSTEDLTQLYVGTSTGRSYRINLNSGNLP